MWCIAEAHTPAPTPKPIKPNARFWTAALGNQRRNNSVAAAKAAPSAAGTVNKMNKLKQRSEVGGQLPWVL